MNIEKKIVVQLKSLNLRIIIFFKSSGKMSERVEHLTNLKKDGSITFEQANELERFLTLNMFINLAKARARILLVD